MFLWRTEENYPWTRICFLRENWRLPPIGVMQFCTESQVLIQQRGINSESELHKRLKYMKCWTCINSNGVKYMQLLFKSIQKGITSKLYKQEFWFLCSARRLMILNICMTFQEGIFNCLHVKHRHNFVTDLLLQSSKVSWTFFELQSWHDHIAKSTIFNFKGP